MTLRTRRRMFYTLVLLFFIIGGAVVLFAEGWRLDFFSWQFEKIGGIYIRSFPQNADISLNGKSVRNQSGFLTTGTLISDLLPRTYLVSLSAPGYQIWHESASVLPSFVTQFKYAVLVPEAPSAAASSSVKQLLLATPTSTIINPENPSEKITITRNRLSLFDITQATMTATVATPGTIASAKWLSPNLIGILQSDGELFLYNPGGDAGPQKLADTVRSFSANRNGTMVATLERTSLEVFSLRDPSIYYRFNLPAISEANRTLWYADNNHLFVVYPRSISFLDFTDTALSNFLTVGQGTQPLYDPQANTLYLTSATGTVIAYRFPS